MQLDRINNNKDYSPNNCRWVDRKTNMRNRRNTITIHNKTLGDIAEGSNIKYKTLYKRFKKYGDIQKIKTCEECNKEYIVYRINQKFCSNKCRCKNKRKRNKQKRAF